MRVKGNFKLILSLVCIILCLAMVVPFAGCKKQDAEDSLEPLVVTSAEDAIAKMADLGQTAGYENALSELTEKNTATIDGDSYYRLQQNYQGIPVYGRTVVCATDEDGNVTSVTGNALDIEDSIDLTPTVTQEEIEVIITAYLTEELGHQSANILRIDELKSDHLCIYNTSGSIKSHLAYQIDTSGYSIIVDAHNAGILSCQQSFVSNDGFDSNHNTNPPIDIRKGSDGTYILRDITRNIYIYDAGNQTYWDPDSGAVFPDVLTLVCSQDNLFGNEDDSSINALTAVSYLEALCDIYDYYATNLHEFGVGVWAGIFNDALGGDTDNAGGGIADIQSEFPSIPPCYDSQKYNGRIGVVIVGSAHNDKYTDSIDTLAHEYTHVITRNHVDWDYSVVETKDGSLSYSGSLDSGAIDEALSDIFGEFIQEALTGKMDWRHLGRPMNNPSLSGFPRRAGEIDLHNNGWMPVGTRTTDYSHGYSTVISHAAYLMWNGIDGNESKMISTDDLAKLWYRAMLMMSSDCDFITCRKLVEYAAESMDNLDKEQKACIREAFDKVGIFPIDSEESEWAEHIDYHLPKESEINVYTDSGERCTNYIVNITGVTSSFTPIETSETESLPDEYVNKRLQARKFLNSAFNKSYRKTYEVNSNEAFPLDLPVGFYTIAISNKYSDAIYELSVCVGTTGKEASIELYTAYQNPLVVVIPDEPPSKLEYVTDAYATNATCHYKESDVVYDFHIPRINLPGSAIEQINTEIYNSLYPIITEAVLDINEYGYPGISSEVSYHWAVNGDILSLVIRNYKNPTASGWYEYIVYNISISKGTILPDAILIEAAGFSSADYYQRAKEVLGSDFWSGWDLSHEYFTERYNVEAFNRQLKETLSDENIAQSLPYINEHGQLCMIAKEYALAGGNYYWHELNMIDFNYLSYYDEPATLSSSSNQTSDTISSLPEVEANKESPMTCFEYQVGDRFYFGSYEQDGNRSNGTEPIQWRVLKVESDRILVISEKAIECKPFYSEDITIDWEYSELRYWLNTDMYITAFSEAERNAILISQVAAEANPQNNIDPGSDTSDYLFIPSISETQQYFSSNNDRRCSATQYAINKGAYVDNGSTWWLLRNPGDAGDKVANVNTDGRIDYVGSRVENVNGAVRIMMWIGINNAENHPDVEPTVEPATDPNQDTPAWYVTEQGLHGKWSVDTERTMDYNGVSMNDMFGIPYNDSMEFGEQGTFKYFITFYGGSGQYQISDNHINYSIVTYDWGGQEESGVIQVQVIDDTVYLIQDVLGYTVFWKRV